MILKTSIAIAATFGVLAAVSGAAATEIAISDEQVAAIENRLEQAADRGEEITPARIRYEIRYVTQGTHTGSRVDTAEPNLGLPISIISGEQLRDDWLR